MSFESLVPDEVKNHSLKYELVGSRITCNPPVTGTDLDILVMSDDNSFPVLIHSLEQAGFQFDGSEFYANALEEGVGFRSFRHGEINLVITTDDEFYKRFSVASALAKRFNLLEKVDRIALFQAVLYGNHPDCIPA